MTSQGSGDDNSVMLDTECPQIDQLTEPEDELPQEEEA